MVKTKEREEEKIWAFLGVFLTVVGFILVLLVKKDNKYALFYAKQGLIIFIVAIIVSVINWIVGWIPVIGGIIATVLWAGVVIVWIAGMIYSLSGKEKDIPIIGEFAKKIKI